MADHISNDLNARVDTWKKKLLDLSKNNRLLNYRETKSATLRITKPGLVDLWDRFVLREQELTFPYLDDKRLSELEELEKKEGPGCRPGSAQTNRTLREQQRVLRNIRNKARSFISEQGINVLYLSFGFMRWKESESSDQVLSSPLVLVPISLQWDSITSPFVAAMRDDEIVVNPTLSRKLETDFGLELPAFSQDDPIEGYLSSVRELVGPQGWEVADEVSMSLLSFMKINMYNDLERHREEIVEHPVIRALGGDVGGLTYDVSDLDGYDHDSKGSPLDTHLILDADSSQMDAVLCAKKGASFVLQGPPGTGKSQTITNIIAECLADGKKVLFVSEKMAALDVVHRRLKGAGLDDFCLVLHSHKAGKKEVLQQLGASLELSDKRVSIRDEAFMSLEQLVTARGSLNAYDRELHTVIEPLGMSVFEANGQISINADARDIVFSLADVRNTTRDGYRAMNGVLRRYSGVVAEMKSDLAGNPWRGSSVALLGNELRHDLGAKLPALSASLGRLADLTAAVQELGLAEPPSVDGLERLAEPLAVAEESPGARREWLTDGDLEALEAAVRIESRVQRSFTSLAERANLLFGELPITSPWLDRNASRTDREWLERIDEAAALVRGLVADSELYTAWNAQRDNAYVARAIEELKGKCALVADLQASVSGGFSEGVYSLDAGQMLERFERLYTPSFLCAYKQHGVDLDTLAKVERPEAVLDDGQRAVLLRKAARLAALTKWRDASDELREYESLVEELESLCEPEINAIPYGDIYLRFKESCRSIGKVFNSQYREDKKSVSRYIKGAEGKQADDTILGILGKLRRRDELRCWVEASQEIRELEELEGEVYPSFEEGILALDIEGLEARFRSDYTAPFEDALVRYEQDMGAVAPCSAGSAVSHEEAHQLLERLVDIGAAERWLDERAPLHSALLCELYKGKQTDFGRVEASFGQFQAICALAETLDEMRDALSAFCARKGDLEPLLGHPVCIEQDWAPVLQSIGWSRRFAKAAEAAGIPLTSPFASRACQAGGFSDACRAARESVIREVSEWRPLAEWFFGLFSEDAGIAGLGIHALRDRVDACAGNIAALEEWLDYRSIAGECSRLGLGECVAAIEGASLPAEGIIPAFRKRFFRLWLDSVLPELPAVASFRRRSHEAAIEEFGRLDKQQADIARSRIKAHLVNGLPSLDRFTGGGDEVHVLRRELAKQRRIMPIRRLFSTIPNLIMTLKPCLMMSPLSVSLFLESDAFQFDTVIFDEASQVCTENAVGAIFRGKQVIIAGDSKQLPPSSFFMAAASGGEFEDEDEDEADDSSAFESVLDEASMLPERTLLWHYRSRHEHLIAFSNAKIYRGRLTTFPSCVERVEDNGVEYVHVPGGFYDRGGRRGNAPEAEKVADLVFDHFRRNPGRTLGVIAFGTVQEQAIDAAIRKRRMEDQSFERFFDEEAEESFFVKSLENVQGDERDTIIFSIGYAKDASGVMRMAFGPLSRVGGERRLNVAITRAKYNVKLVGSILPTDILTERVKSEGPKLLRSYIEFAMRGPEVLEAEATASDEVEHDSPFEESVFNFLDRKGYKLSTQVGCSGYRIDMAVKHPERDGRFVLGIECDGAMYHSARTARERDRLRQDVLESMGWKIYRIWSTDWIKDPANERRKLIEAVDEAIAGYVESFTPSSMERDSAAPVDEIATIVERVPSERDLENPYGFVGAKEPVFNQLKKDRWGRVDFTDCLDHLVKLNYPLHFEVACQELSFLLGKERVCATVRNSVAFAISRSKNVIRRGDFLFFRNREDIPARGGLGRKIQHIHPEELATAMYLVAKQSIGAGRDYLVNETAHAYGFNRITSKVSEAFDKAYELLLEREGVQVIEGKVKIGG